MWPGHKVSQRKQVHDHGHITAIGAQDWDGELHC